MFNKIVSAKKQINRKRTMTDDRKKAFWRFFHTNRTICLENYYCCSEKVRKAEGSAVDK